jgi:hypothetical protein
VILLRTLLAGVLTVAFLGLAGCQDEDDPGPSPTGSASSATSEPTAASESTGEPTDSTPSPSVPVATGPELRLETSSVHAPEGWLLDDKMADFEASAYTRREGSLIQLLDRQGLNVDDTLDDQYDAIVQGLPDGAKHTRQPDVLLGEEQAPAVFITYTTKDRPGESFAVLFADRNGRSVSLNFDIMDKDLQQDPDVIASVIASFEWI